MFGVRSQAATTCSKNGTSVIYTNGINTKENEAQEAMEKIDALVKEDALKFNRISIDKKLNYKLAYNYEENKAKDILEATVQRLPQSYLNILQVTNAYSAFSHFIKGDSR